MSTVRERKADRRTDPGLFRLLDERTGRTVGWEAMWKEPGGKQRSQVFRTKEEAKAHRESMRVSVKTGAYVSPRKLTFADYFPTFLESKPRRPSTKELYQGMAERYLFPTFGRTQLAQIDPDGINAWLAKQTEAGTGKATISSAYRLLRAVLSQALRSRLISWNPTIATDPPNVARRGMRFLDAPEVERLASAVPDQYRALIYTLAYGGLRIGEAAGLRVQDFDELRGRLTIERAVCEVSGELCEGPTKTGAIRTVTLPAFLCKLLSEHAATYARDGGYLFPAPEGGPLRPNNFRKRVFYKALTKAKLPPMRVHDLRHTCASLLIAQGAHAKQIAERLGHSNPTVTMSVYAHILPSLDEQLADGLEATFQQGKASAAEFSLSLLSAEVVSLPTK